VLLDELGKIDSGCTLVGARAVIEIGLFSALVLPFLCIISCFFPAAAYLLSAPHQTAHSRVPSPFTFIVSAFG
jgi:hypothetical protein